jgi:hypothetical protein
MSATGFGSGTFTASALFADAQSERSINPVMAIPCLVRYV